MTLGFVLPAVTAAFALSTTQAGLLGTVGLVTSAVGGAMAGALADAIGRVRVLILSIGSYALFTLLAGCAQSYEQLLVFLTLQGLGFGGEWAAGAVLVAEYAQATQRGQVIGAVQSAWSIGYAGVLIANTLAFSLAPPDLAWRMMFWLGAVPAVVLLWVRTFVQESPVYRAEVAARGAGRAGRRQPGSALLGLPDPVLGRRCLAARRGLASGCPPADAGAPPADRSRQRVGGCTGWFARERAGRPSRRGLALFALGSALSAPGLTCVAARRRLAGVRPSASRVGFFSSGIFERAGGYLAERPYPTELRDDEEDKGVSATAAIGVRRRGPAERRARWRPRATCSASSPCCSCRDTCGKHLTAELFRFARIAGRHGKANASVGDGSWYSDRGRSARHTCG